VAAALAEINAEVMQGRGVLLRHFILLHVVAQRGRFLHLGHRHVAALDEYRLALGVRRAAMPAQPGEMHHEGWQVGHVDGQQRLAILQ
jgi:hypothetical protein